MRGASSLSLPGTVARGLIAGAVGTLAMDLVWFSRFKRGGGEGGFGGFEVTRNVTSWEQAPAPAVMGRKLIEGVTRREVPVERAATVSNAMHWAYGTTWTAGLALAVRALAPRRAWWNGPAFGALVWGSDFVTLPLAGVYEPIWRYDAPTLAKDLSAHVVFGTAANVALRGLSRR